MKKINVVIKTQFEAIHNWPSCPRVSVAYLKDPHRHVFHVVMKWNVQGSDRDIEFIMMKEEVTDFIRSNWDRANIGSLSCEQIALELLNAFDASFVSVFEDNENGAEVYV